MAEEKLTQDPQEGAPTEEPIEDQESVSEGEPEEKSAGEPEYEEEVEEISPERYAELLDIERRHKEQSKQYGRLVNEVGQLRKIQQQVSPQPTPTVEDRLTEEDFEDPERVTRKFNRIAEELQSLKQAKPITQDEVRLLLLQEKAMDVIEEDPVLKSMGYDESGYPRAMGLIDQAAQWATLENERLGQRKYKDPRSAWEGFKKTLSGGSELKPGESTEKTRKAIVRQIKRGTTTVSPGETSPTTSIAEQYVELTKSGNQKKVTAFYKKLSKEDKKRCDEAFSLSLAKGQ